MHRPMHPEKKAQFVGEFPFLEKIPNLDHAADIKVATCENAILRDIGVLDAVYNGGDGGQGEIPELDIGHTYYYAVCGSELTRLQHVDALGKHAWDCESPDDDEERPADPPTNGEQLFHLGLRPEYIVKCHKVCGSAWEIWTIYKMDKYSLDAFYRQARYPKVA